MWLPPSYRILYTEINKTGLRYSTETIQFILDKLNGYLDSGALFCKQFNDMVARVENIEYKDGKIWFWLNELKPNYFSKNNIHVGNYCIKLEIAGKAVGGEARVDSVSSILELEHVSTET